MIATIVVISLIGFDFYLFHNVLIVYLRLLFYHLVKLAY